MTDSPFNAESPAAALASGRRWLRYALFVLAFACSQRQGAISNPDTEVTSALQQLRAATQPFAVLDSAVAAGYAREVIDCLVHEHHGAMGFHHTNPRYLDGTVNVKQPEILLYERLPSGEYRLNGVEFIVPYQAWPRDSIPPRALGEAMRHEENLRFWYLHVWAWTPNPDGLFADFHPDIRWPPGVTEGLPAERRIFTRSVFPRTHPRANRPSDMTEEQRGANEAVKLPIGTILRLVDRSSLRRSSPVLTSFTTFCAACSLPLIR